MVSIDRVLPPRIFVVRDPTIASCAPPILKTIVSIDRAILVVRDPSPRTIHGVAATQRNIHVAAAASPRPVSDSSRGATRDASIAGLAGGAAVARASTRGRALAGAGARALGFAIVAALAERVVEDALSPLENALVDRVVEANGVPRGVRRSRTNFHVAARRRNSSPRTICVAAAAAPRLVFMECHSRGVAAGRPQMSARRKYGKKKSTFTTLSSFQVVRGWLK